MNIQRIFVAIENQVHAPAIQYAAGLLLEPFDVQVTFVSFSKTPPEDALVISYGKDTPRYRCAFHLYIKESPFFDNYLKTKYIPKITLSKKSGVPVLFSPDELVFNKKKNSLHTNQDLLASAFFWTSRYIEICQEERDQHKRYHVENALSYKHNLLQTPIVDEYTKLLKNWFMISGIHVPLKNRYSGYDFIICPTHDIDQVNKGRLECLYHEYKALKSNPSKHLTKMAELLFKGFFNRDVYWNFKEILALERKHNAHSTFYFLAKSSDQPDVPYQFHKRAFRTVAKNILHQGSEIGLHGSYHSVMENTSLIEEKAYIEKAIKQPITSIRQHYLRLDVRNYWDRQERAGFDIDTSLGYARRPGFRAGIARPFQPFNFNTQKPYAILEIPLIIMDGTFRHYIPKTPEQAWDHMLPILESVKQHRGIASILWHNTFLVKYKKYEGWQELYEHILDWVNRNNGRNMSIQEAASIWQQQGKTGQI